jgi:sulfur carrier protein ThiS
MKIRLKLYATLSDYLPKNSRQNVVELDVPEASTVAAVIQSCNLPVPLVHLVLCNGAYVSPELRPQQILQAGDTLAIWPPVAGG